jgi:hypothetical protein
MTPNGLAPRCPGEHILDDGGLRRPEIIQPEELAEVVAQVHGMTPSVAHVAARARRWRGQRGSRVTQLPETGEPSRGCWTCVLNPGVWRQGTIPPSPQTHWHAARPVGRIREDGCRWIRLSAGP